MADQLSYLDFSSIESEEELKNYAETINLTILDIGSKDEKSLKQVMNELLNKIHNQIINPTASPKSKFMSILMLKQFTQNHTQKKEDKNKKFFSFLAPHVVIQEMKNIAEETDPLKQINQKGKKYFPSSSSVGNDFIRLILELIQYLSLRFPANNKKQPSTYRRNYEQLVTKKVVFPLQYKFLLFANKKGADEMSDTRRFRSGQAQQEQPQGGRSTTKAQIFHMYNRLLNFVESLDEEASTVQSEIRNIHSQIKNEVKKYEGMEAEMGQMIERDNEAFTKYISVLEFMHKELQFHEQYISSNNTDFQSYILAIKLQGEKNFPQLNQATPQPKGQPYPPIGKGVEKDKVNPVSSRLRDDLPPKQSSFDPNAVNLVSNYFSKLEERSKSPIAGFKKINESLSKQKSGIKKSISPINKSKNNISKSMASLKESKISPIFSNPPNLYPPPKNFQGREIYQSEPLEKVLKIITKNQGHRRFKTANFKGKSSLFENEHIQIGYKSQAVYEEISGFKMMIKIELFFGNLCEDRIQDISLDFKGDQNILLYSNPRIIESSLPRGDQNKIDLIIIPIKVPFPLLVMTLNYSILGEHSQHKIIIPNSVLKLTHFMSITKEEFNQRWMIAEIFKTSEVKLSHYLAPDSFTKWIPQLGQLSNYTAFAAPGSKRDYELYCAVILIQRIECVLKISIRPNLQIIIQLGLEDNSDQALQYSSYFLQTLHHLLKEDA